VAERGRKEKPRIVLSVSGTGGHVFPLLALADELKQHLEMHVVVEDGDLANRERFSDIGCQVYEISAGKLRRYHGRTGWYFFHPKNVRDNARDGFKACRGVVQSLRLLRRLRPAVVFVKGGYVGVPLGIAAGLLGIQLVLHDSDTVPSLTSRVLARWASRIAVGFPREYYDYPSRKLVHTGIPIRSTFTAGAEKKSSHSSGKPLIAIVGGSQGSHKLNQLVFKSLKDLLSLGRVVHITGSHDIALGRRLQQQAGPSRYQAFDFMTSQYPSLIKSAEVVICRAGATTVAECALSGAPMVVIPNAFLSEGHQLRNGEALAEASAATILSEEAAVQSPNLLLEAVKGLLDDSKRRDWQRRNAAALFPPDASERLVKLLIRSAHGSSKT
jgi:UDP-N-acetylglucosamine--N-acetylmuramyl-(pentapeptide) pyrophosphoryl-undecaprenol N-acetylglucosamine transferase